RNVTGVQTCALPICVPLDWHKHKADDGSYFLDKRKTLVVVERANRTIRQVGLVDDLVPDDGWLQVSCGGFSMLAGQSGPWEGHRSEERRGGKGGSYG